MEQLKQKAQRLVERKISNHAYRARQALASQDQGDMEASRRIDTDYGEPIPGTLLHSGTTTGIEHLQRLDLVPRNKKIHQAPGQSPIMMEQERVNISKGNYNPLHTKPRFRYVEDEQIKIGSQGRQACNNCGGAKPNVKSGKFAKYGTNIVRQEQWPHNAVSRKYVKRSSFDNMDYETFVAGEVKIIYSMYNQDMEEALSC